MSQESNSLREGMVIIGGGIIDLSSACSLALDLEEAAQSSTQHACRLLPKITIVESSDRLYPVASCPATSGLGSFGFGNDRMPGKAVVASLSYKMHFEMAAKYKGEELYGFGRQLLTPAVANITFYVIST